MHLTSTYFSAFVIVSLLPSFKSTRLWSLRVPRSLRRPNVLLLTVAPCEPLWLLDFNKKCPQDILSHHAYQLVNDVMGELHLGVYSSLQSRCILRSHLHELDEIAFLVRVTTDWETLSQKQITIHLISHYSMSNQVRKDLAVSLYMVIFYASYFWFWSSIMCHFYDDVSCIPIECWYTKCVCTFLYFWSPLSTK